MSEADDLSARINEARNENQRAKDTLSEAQEISNAIRDAQGRLHDPETGRFIPDPNNPRSNYTWTDSDRRAAWRRLVEDPNSPLLPEQREEIRNRGYRGPQFYNPVTGRLETTELSHEPVPLREGGTEVVPRDPREHARVDRDRHLPKDHRDLTEAQLNAIRDAFWDRDGYREYDPRTWGTSPTALPTNSFTESPTAPIVDTAGETPSGGVLRGASRALGPAGSLIGGAYSLYEAYDADDGFGENFRETAGGIAGGAAGGWGGAAAGAALGTAIFPGVGTVVGGIAGGIAGGIGGEKIGEFLGGLF